MEAPPVGRALLLDLTFTALAAAPRWRATSFFTTFVSASGPLAISAPFRFKFFLPMSPSKKILMVAYACHPQGGGEHWLGWGWAETASRLGSVWLITPPKHAEEILVAAAGKKIIPVFLALPGWLVMLSDHLGATGSWLRKFCWHELARRVSRCLDKQQQFDVVHQTTFHSFRVPFSGRGLGIPSVWGPVAGGESTPVGFDHYLGDAARDETHRRWMNRATLMLPWIRQSLLQCSVIFVSNRTTRDFLPTKYHSKCRVVPPNAVRAEDLQPLGDETKSSNPAILLYVGNCVERRGLPLLLEALTDLDCSQVALVVAGDGPALANWQKQADQLGVSDRVTFLGMIPPDEVRLWYDRASVFVFPSLRDSGGSGLMEAMTRGLPVVCLNWAGPAEMIDASCGILVGVGSPKATVAGLRKAIVALTGDPLHARALGLAGRNRAESEFTWDRKYKVLTQVYSQLTRQP